ncbi:MAG: ParB N-terminal domain-containing protein [Thermoleophilia bacterium]|nr:ParB N-terminal domain-containing protein [Thermoleophilia bacterium]
MTETLTNPEIHCSYDELVDLVALVPHPRNPNTHPANQIELLAKIIRHQGWRAPITVSKRSGFIIRGHGRLMAAQTLGVEQAPVDYQDYASEAEEWADLIADNRIAELAEINNDALTALMAELSEAGDLDMELTGFGEQELEQLMAPELSADDLWKGMPEFDQHDVGQYQIIVSFRDADDVEDFAKKIGQEITIHREGRRTASIWHPAHERESMTDYVYEDES